MPRHAHANSHAAICAYDLEDYIENAEDDGVAMELGCFDDGDEENCKGDPPEIVAELAAELSAEEILVGPVGGGSLRVAAVGYCHGTFQALEEIFAFVLVLVEFRWILWMGIFFVSEDAKRTFLVDICVADCHCHGEGGDVHH